MQLFCSDRESCVFFFILFVFYLLWTTFENGWLNKYTNINIDLLFLDGSAESINPTLWKWGSGYECFSSQLGMYLKIELLVVDRCKLKSNCHYNIKCLFRIRLLYVILLWGHEKRCVRIFLFVRRYYTGLIKCQCKARCDHYPHYHDIVMCSLFFVGRNHMTSSKKLICLAWCRAIGY